VLLLVIAVATMIGLRYAMNRSQKPPSTPRDYNEIMASGELNVVTDYNSIGYYVSGDSTHGISAGMIRALEKEWGMRVHLFGKQSR